MDKKVSETVNSICTILGGALLLYPLIDEATKTIIPEMQKIAAGEIDDVKLLPMKEEKDDEEQKTPEDKISDLKRKIAELEGQTSQSDEYKSEN